jgi:hypothetical protein
MRPKRSLCVFSRFSLGLPRSAASDAGARGGHGAVCQGLGAAARCQGPAPWVDCARRTCASNGRQGGQGYRMRSGARHAATRRWREVKRPLPPPPPGYEWLTRSERVFVAIGISVGCLVWIVLLVWLFAGGPSTPNVVPGCEPGKPNARSESGQVKKGASDEAFVC